MEIHGISRLTALQRLNHRQPKIEIKTSQGQIDYYKQPNATMEPNDIAISTQILSVYILHVHFREENLNTEKKEKTERTIEGIKRIPKRQFYWLLNLATAKAQTKFHPKQKTLAIARKEIQLLRIEKKTRAKALWKK